MSDKVGVVKKLFVSTEDMRLSKEIVELDKDGVLGDKFYAKNSSRAILITSLDSYKIAKENSIEINFSDLGENILIDINPYHLKIGDKVYIGDVILEITHNCTLCKSLAKVDEKLPTILKNDRGIFARTVKSGIVKIDDKVII
ncbi:MAG: MOSC domain-containing protein [Campylobacterales bacterium]